MKTIVHLWSYLTECFLELEMFQTKFLEKIKTHFTSNNFFFFQNHAFYEITWKNILQPGTLIACWTRKATNAHSECVILIAFPLQQWLHERATMLRFTYADCLVTFHF
jgi:hypothetical protein